MPPILREALDGGLPQSLERMERTAQIGLQHNVRAAAVTQQNAAGKPHEIAQIGWEGQFDAAAALAGRSDLSCAKQHLF